MNEHDIQYHLKHRQQEFQIDFSIVNGENSAGGRGITPKIANDLFTLFDLFLLSLFPSYRKFRTL